MLEPDAVNYLPEDLLVGTSITAYGREIFIYDCDPFTREFYNSYMGYEQPKIPLQEPEHVRVALSFSPHTGFGTEEDSMASCLHLVPHAPKRDVNKLMGDAGKALRFLLQMKSGKIEDECRRFVLAIFLADDSVGIWELKQRNSGHGDGKFASKARKKNPATGTWFTQRDFSIGAVVEINSMPFEILRADDATLKHMEKNPNEFPQSDASRIGAE